MCCWLCACGVVWVVPHHQCWLNHKLCVVVKWCMCVCVWCLFNGVGCFVCESKCHSLYVVLYCGGMCVNSLTQCSVVGMV